MSDERGLERTEDFQRHQDELAVARIRGALNGHGDPFCEDCGDEIEARRREALPSARRCIDCQALFERASRR